MRHVMAVFVLAALIGCGRDNGITSVDVPPPTTASTPTVPAWRLDRSDVLNWMVGHTPEGLSVWPTGGGGHGMGVVLEGSQGSGSFYWVKLTPNNYERFSYDSSWIYWREDHESRGMVQQGVIPYGTVAYEWTSVRWLPRRLPAPGTTIENTDNRIHWFNGSCEVTSDQRYPVYVTYWGMERLPQGEAIHTSFQVGGSPFSEHQWYTWEDGWVRWEYRKDGEPGPRHVSDFTTRVPRASDYDSPCSR